MDQNQDASVIIKNRFLKVHVLHIPDNTDRFQFFSTISKTAAGSTLYQIQNATPK